MLKPIYGFISPNKWEFLADDKEIKWGNTSKAQSYKSLKMTDLSSLCFNCGIDEDCIYAIKTNQQKVHLPDYIFRSTKSEEEFKDFIRQNQPSIKIRQGLPSNPK